MVDGAWQEVQRLNQGEIIRHPVDRRIVSRLEADEEVRVIACVKGVLQWAQYLRQGPETHLAGSTGAGGEVGQTNDVVASHRSLLPVHRGQGAHPRIA